MTNDNPRILDLRQPDVELPKVVLDSGEYELLSPQEYLDPVVAIRLSKLGAEAQRLQLDGMDIEDVSVEDTERLKENLREQVGIICPGIPPDELAAMSFPYMMRVMNFFRVSSALDEDPTQGALGELQDAVQSQSDTTA